jgi:hypothetical protein
MLCFDLGSITEETTMFHKLATCYLAAIAGAAMLALSMGHASAFTIVSPSFEQPVASAQIEKVYWYRGWGWRGGYRHCWINRWGHRVCRW